MIYVYNTVSEIIIQLNITPETLLLTLGIIILVLMLTFVFIMNKKNYLSKLKSKDLSPTIFEERRKSLQEKVDNAGIEISNITKEYQIETTGRIEKEKNYLMLNKQLRELTTRLQQIREEERTRISREIHDELGQQLTAIKMDLSWIKKKHSGSNTELKEKIDSLLKLVDETVYTIRKIATDLRPGILDDLGLLAALEWQCTEFERRSGIKCRFNSSLKDIDFNKEFSTMVFRIFQETLTNIAKHSGANRVSINLNLKNNTLFLEINDNGTGIKEDEINNTSSLGLLGMKERVHIFGGELSIIGTQEFGTTVKLKIPLPADGKNVLTGY